MPLQSTTTLFALLTALTMVTPGLVRELVSAVPWHEPAVLSVLVVLVVVALLRGRRIRMTLRFGLQ